MTTKPFALAVAALSLAAFPTGCAFDPLGLGGNYAGSMTLHVDGDLEVTGNGGVVNAGMKADTTKDSELSIAGGTSADAVAYGDVVGCPLDLEIDGDELGLASQFDCRSDDTENEYTISGQSVTSAQKTTMRFTRFSVRDLGDGDIAVDAEGTTTSESRDTDGQKTSTSADFTMTFDGWLVAK